MFQISLKLILNENKLPSNYGDCAVPTAEPTNIFTFPTTASPSKTQFKNTRKIRQQTWMSGVFFQYFSRFLAAH